MYTRIGAAATRRHVSLLSHTTFEALRARARNERFVKKKFFFCFAGASAVLHCQNGQSHRVAPETKKIFRKKKFFFRIFRRFLDVF